MFTTPFPNETEDNFVPLKENQTIFFWLVAPFELKVQAEGAPHPVSGTRHAVPGTSPVSAPPLV